MEIGKWQGRGMAEDTVRRQVWPGGGWGEMSGGKMSGGEMSGVR